MTDVPTAIHNAGVAMLGLGVFWAVLAWWRFGFEYMIIPLAFLSFGVLLMAMGDNERW